MSDARTDFFSSGANEASKAASREDFFNDPDAVIAKIADKKKAASKETKFTQPYAYFDPQARREANIEQPAVPLQEIPAGFNSGVMQLLGQPVNALVDASNLVSAGAGVLQSKVTGEAPSAAFDPVDKANVPLNGAWFEQMLNSSPLGDVTSVRDPSNPEARILHAAAAGVPGGLVGGGSVPVNTLSGAAGGTAGAIAAEAGADPATQATMSLLAGHAASRIPMDTPPSAALQEEAPEDSQAKLNRVASKQSMGAAGAAVDLQKLSPELREAVDQAVAKTGGAVNPDVLARHIQADSLPVKVRLSEGQALGDERLISLELNARGKHEAYSKGFAEQNKALTENLRVLRDESGPEVFSTNPVEHADTLIKRYEDIDAARKADISAKYKQLEEANGGQFPVDGSTFIKAADTALASKMKGRYLPAEVRGDVEQFRDNAGYMTFEQFENLRTNLASAARTAERQGNGNAAAAVNIVRRELESLPMSGEGAKLKPLADAARQAAKERFDALDADPAYKAAVNETVAPDRFIQRFVIGGTRDNVAKLADAMSGDERAAQTVRVATLEHLRSAAGIDNGYNGNFSQASYNKALQQLEPKLGSLLDPKTAEHVQNLGDVARYTQFQPRGSFVNNSNTFVSAAAEKAADALEGAINYKTGGIPIASEVRKKLNENKVRKAAEQTFAPGAGLSKLSDLVKQGKKK